MKKIKIGFDGKVTLIGETFARMRENGIPFIELARWGDCGFVYSSKALHQSIISSSYYDRDAYSPVTIREADYEMVKLISSVEVKVHDE